MGSAGVNFRQGSGHSNLTHPFVGHAGVEFRERCSRFNLTHPCVGNAGEKIRRKLPFQVDAPLGEPPEEKI